MRAMTQASFPTASSKDALERGEVLSPRFDASGLVAVVATHAQTGEVLMFAHMNAEALARTMELGEAVYFSRSRNEIWHKGATSGQIQQIVEMRIDCDQDCIWLKVLPQGDGGACHVGFRSCFYRVIEDGKLVDRP
jgi:phosphoribosyl-AMP cyclohydrolase